VRCDGLVAATPVGSTGYNLANQGPILAWGVEGYVVSYISPHSLTARALVVAPRDVLTVVNATGREPVEVAVDGEQVGDLEAGQSLEVRFAHTVAVLGQLPGTSFYGRIREKFGHLAV
jgi:NAD+ kinase